MYLKASAPVWRDCHCWWRLSPKILSPPFFHHLLTTFAWPSGRQREGDWCDWERRRPRVIPWPLPGHIDRLFSWEMPSRRTIFLMGKEGKEEMKKKKEREKKIEIM